MLYKYTIKNGHT